MPQFTTVSTIPRSPADVFALIVDLTQWPLFTGYGPLPGIRAASLPPGEVVGLGARIRVDDADDTHHYELVEAFAPAQLLTLRMELSPPASYFMAHILESVQLAPEGAGTRLTRTFTATPRAWYTWPMAWLFGSFMLRRAIERHNAAVASKLA